MTCDASLMTLVQWLSPAFPTGAFAYSHGLESAIGAGDITDAATLFAWLEDLLRHGSARNDAILMLHAARCGDLDALADTARALAVSAERLHETEAMGAALTRTTNALLGTASPDRPYPVALGAAARSLTLAPERLAALAMQAFASNLVSIAVRFVPLGQTEGQRVLARLAPVIADVAAEVSEAPLSALRSGTIRADMHAVWHETMDVRIFRT